MWNANNHVQVWTQVAVSLSHDDNYFTTSASTNLISRLIMVADDMFLAHV